MICWGERKNCGDLPDKNKLDACSCDPNQCIRDYTPDELPLPKEYHLDEVYADLRKKEKLHLEELGDMLAIKSISKNPKYQDQSRQIIDRLASRLQEFEFDVEVVEIKPSLPPKSHCADASEQRLKQYALFANYFSTPGKNMLLIYGHVDVLPVDETELKLWKYDPFMLSKEEDMLYGRGVATAKGPVIFWIQALEAWQNKMDDFPVNVRFLIETNHYNDSYGLRELIKARQPFFKPVDIVIYCTNLWIADQLPLITSSHSGYVHFSLEVQEPEESEAETKPHAREPMSDLCLLMNSLVDKKNQMRVPGMQRHVIPVTQNDWWILSRMEAGVNELKRNLDIKRLPHEQSRPEMLMHRWCRPSLSMHGVETAVPDSKKFNHRPKRAVAKFSIKLVPDQSIEYVIFEVKDYLNEVYRRMRCRNEARLRVLDKLPPVRETRRSPSGLAANKAYKRVFNCELYFAENISICIPFLQELRKYCHAEARLLTLPFYSIHARPDQPNERLSREMFTKNRELCAAMIYEIAQIPPICKCKYVKDYCFEQGKSTTVDFVRLWDERHRIMEEYAVYELDTHEMPVDTPAPLQRKVTIAHNPKEDRNPNSDKLN